MSANAIETRFWSKVVRTNDAECWLWTGGTRNGYGRFEPDCRRNVPRNQIAAHRFAYEALVGPIPDGLTLDHLCNNPSCVNPAHLQPAALRENILRGTSPSALNARKTHCKNGHEYDDANTYWVKTPSGRGRKCRICERARRKARWKENRS